MVTIFAIMAMLLRSFFPALPVRMSPPATGVSKPPAAATSCHITAWPFGISRKIAGAVGAVGRGVKCISYLLQLVFFLRS